MFGSIGKQLGVLLAHCEQDLYHHGGDVDTLKKVALISESYRNFAQGGSPEFTSDFETSYAAELAELNEPMAPRQDKGVLLGAYARLRQPDLD